jgi:hypothetical protein
MATSAARPTQGMGVSGIGLPLDNGPGSPLLTTGVCARGYGRRVASITTRDPVENAEDFYPRTCRAAWRPTWSRRLSRPAGAACGETEHGWGG